LVVSPDVIVTVRVRCGKSDWVLNINAGFSLKASEQARSAYTQLSYDRNLESAEVA